MVTAEPEYSTHFYEETHKKRQKTKMLMHMHAHTRTHTGTQHMQVQSTLHNKLRDDVFCFLVNRTNISSASESRCQLVLFKAVDGMLRNFRGTQSS